MFWILLIAIVVLCIFPQGRKFAIIALALWVGAYLLRFLVVSVIFHGMLAAAFVVAAYACYQLFTGHRR